MQTERAQAQPTVQIDNERVVVTEWRFSPGAETGWHRHGYDYVVVPLTDGKLQLETSKGQRISELKTGQSYGRAAGVEHNVVNANEYEFVFVEIELKQSASGVYGAQA
ncbi:cupin domain-containing protein [Polaromonas sp. P1(28)-13]|nr:cupin domain-containing protein [Polaromonas sp. P1(28)-13]